MNLRNFKLIFSTFLLLFILAACSEKTKVVNVSQLVRVDSVVGAEGIKSVNYPGKTKAAQSVNISFRVSGRIEEVYVSKGEYVTKGQLVAAMDDRDYRLQLSATEAEYRQVKAEAERVMALYEENATSANNYDKARYGLEQITAKYNNHKNQLADTKLYAPFNGYVQDVLFEDEEMVSAGMPVLSLFSSDNIEVTINIPAGEYQTRNRFDTFGCRFDVFSGTSFPLKLLSINPKANANQLYEVRLLLNTEHHQITPGMNTMVQISYIADEKQPVEIPANAIFNTGNGSQVFVYDAKSGTIALRNIEVLTLHTDGVALIVSGLEVGEEVVSSGVHHLKEGQQVTPMAKPSKTNVGGLL